MFIIAMKWCNCNTKAGYKERPHPCSSLFFGFFFFMSHLIFTSYFYQLWGQGKTMKPRADQLWVTVEKLSKLLLGQASCWLSPVTCLKAYGYHQTRPAIWNLKLYLHPLRAASNNLESSQGSGGSHTRRNVTQKRRRRQPCVFFMISKSCVHVHLYILKVMMWHSEAWHSENLIR